MDEQDRAELENKIAELKDRLDRPGKPMGDLTQPTIRDNVAQAVADAGGRERVTTAHLEGRGVTWDDALDVRNLGELELSLQQMETVHGQPSMNPEDPRGEPEDPAA
jgi:hypothetical protein